MDEVLSLPVADFSGQKKWLQPEAKESVSVQKIKELLDQLALEKAEELHSLAISRNKEYNAKLDFYNKYHSAKDRVARARLELREVQLQLQKAQEDKGKERMCVVCEDAKARWSWRCGHCCACGDCAKKLFSCPICRKEGHPHKIYFP